MTTIDKTTLLDLFRGLYRQHDDEALAMIVADALDDLSDALPRIYADAARRSAVAIRSGERAFDRPLLCVFGGRLLRIGDNLWLWCDGTPEPRVYDDPDRNATTGKVDGARWAKADERSILAYARRIV